MTFDYQLTADDYVDAQRIHTKKHYGKRGIWVLGALALIIILGVVSLGLWITGQEPPATSLWIIDISLIFTCVWLWSGVSWRKQFYKIQALQAPLKITIADDAILYESARGASNTRWAALEDWRESKTTFLFYTQPNLFFILPKRIMEPEQIPAFREMLIAKIQKS